jgi:hypothetical protein
MPIDEFVSDDDQTVADMALRTEAYVQNKGESRAKLILLDVEYLCNDNGCELITISTEILIVNNCPFDDKYNSWIQYTYDFDTNNISTNIDPTSIYRGDYDLELFSIEDTLHEAYSMIPTSYKEEHSQFRVEIYISNTIRHVWIYSDFSEQGEVDISYQIREDGTLYSERISY